SASLWQLGGVGDDLDHPEVVDPEADDAHRRGELPAGDDLDGVLDGDNMLLTRNGIGRAVIMAGNSDDTRAMRCDGEGDVFVDMALALLVAVGEGLIRAGNGSEIHILHVAVNLKPVGDGRLGTAVNAVD